jgi:hypothetical protein
MTILNDEYMKKELDEITRRVSNKKIVEEWSTDVNKRLKGVGVYAINLHRSSLVININFYKKEPVFADKRDKKPWWNEVKSYAAEMFGIKKPLKSLYNELYQIVIPFENRSQMIKGLEKAENYMMFYLNAVSGYESLTEEQKTYREKWIAGMKNQKPGKTDGYKNIRV